MGAKQSQEVKDALRAMETAGISAAEAARQFGVTAGRLSQVLKQQRATKEKKPCSKN